jgi:hypothetical protein
VQTCLGGHTAWRWRFPRQSRSSRKLSCAAGNGTASMPARSGPILTDDLRGDLLAASGSGDRAVRVNCSLEQLASRSAVARPPRRRPLFVTRRSPLARPPPARHITLLQAARLVGDAAEDGACTLTPRHVQSTRAGMSTRSQRCRRLALTVDALSTSSMAATGVGNKGHRTSPPVGRDGRV